MNAVILDGRDIEDCSLCDAAIDKAIENILPMDPEDWSWFKLRDMNIQPCRSCGACAHITPGECVFRDDMPQIMWAVAAAEVIVFLTPIRYGGYSSQLKKAVDKLLLMALPLYVVEEGHLLHPMRYGHKGLVGIGMAEDLEGLDESCVQAFKHLIGQNAKNMQFFSDTLIVPYMGCSEKAFIETVAIVLAGVRREAEAHEQG